MPSEPAIAVTGASGAVGGMVARRLAERGVPHRLVVRDAGRAPGLPDTDIAEIPGYHDGAAVSTALTGIRTLLFVSAEEAPDRLAQHRTAVAAAAEAGVERIVYTSFVSAAADATFTLARDHAHTEAAIQQAGIALTALRDSLYLDVLPSFEQDGEIRGPAGEGRFAPVARTDVADVAVAALLDDDHAEATYDVTGPQRLTMAEVAATLARARGRPVAHVDERVDEAYASRQPLGAPDWQLDAWVTTYLAIARGELDVASDTVERLTGRPPRSFEAWLADHG